MKCINNKRRITFEVRRGIGLFWWKEDCHLRGITFNYKSSQKNVHFDELLCLYGATFRIKLRLFIRAWSNILFSGWKYILVGK